MHGSFRRYIVTIRMQHATLPPSADHHTMNFQKTNTTLSVLVAILICSSGSRLHAAESSATTNAASTNASTTNAPLTILSPITVVAQDVTNGVVEGTDFRNPGGFGPIDSKAATRTYTPNMENPVSVQVISQDVMQSQQNIYIDDAVQNVAGVTPTPGMGGLGDNFAIRGVAMNNLTFQDGLRVDNANTMFQQSLQNTENVEVVKGPASVLYGQMLPGGLVNMNTKKPLENDYFAADQQIGSFSFYRTTADASGPLNKDKTLLYRINVDQQNNYSYRQFNQNQRFFLFPTFQWKPNDKSQVTLEFTYADLHQVYDNGVPFQTNGIPVSVNRGANFGMPYGNKQNNGEFTVKLSGTHKFNDDLMLHGAVREDFQNGSLPNWTAYAGEVPQGSPQDANVALLPGSYPTWQYWTQEFLVDLTSKFKTWFAKHTVVLGGDFYRQCNTWTATMGTNYLYNNIYTPNYNQAIPGYSPNPAAAYCQAINDASLFLQDQIELPGHIFGTAGFRYDALSYQNTYGAGTNSSLYNNAVTPRFGLMWRPVEPVSIYGSYTANFGPNSTVPTANGAPLPPQSAQQWEIGLKGETPNKKLSSTLSFYQLTQNNLVQPDPENPLSYVAVGQAVSKGMEYQLAGEILPGWRIIGSYSYINAAITQAPAATTSTIADPYSATGFTTVNTPSQVGQRLTGIPFNSGSIWSTYEIQSGPLKRLRFGAGVIYRSQEVAYVQTSTYTFDENGNNNVLNYKYNQEQIPAFATLNLMAAYPFNVGKSKWTAQVNVNNVFNTYYYSGIQPYQAVPAAPVNFMASLKAEF
jgi:iron complex outermembrane receptor protein